MNFIAVHALLCVNRTIPTEHHRNASITSPRMLLPPQKCKLVTNFFIFFKKEKMEVKAFKFYTHVIIPKDFLQSDFKPITSHS